MRAKPKPTRNTFTPELLVKQLAEDVPRFKSETPQVQAALASLVWIGATKLRQHAVHDGYMSFHYTDLAAQFDGQFKAINARLGFLDVKNTWRWSANGKATDVFTKGYRFSPVVQASRDRFLAKRSEPLMRLLSADATAFRTPPKAVDSLDMAGVPTTRWKAANIGDALSLVPVSIDSLKMLQQDIDKKITAWKRTGQPQDLWMGYPSLDYLVELRDKTRQIIRMAHTDVAGLGYVMHRYVESESGRLYALGGASLQNTPGVIKQAALAGMLDYDVENCHFAIIDQMAKLAGVQCVAIEHYMAHKKSVRAEIAAEIGISVNQTKTCLLAVMYGARTTTWHENAIPEAIGTEAAKKLNDLPLFANIADDVKLARRAILEHIKPNRQGGLVNAFGKPIKTDGHTSEQRLAHLIQGVEAQALRACIELHPGEIVLVQHDGFTATNRLDVAKLEQAIKAATGYALKLEEKPVLLDLAGQFDRAVENQFSKVRKSRKAKTGAGFSRFNTHSFTVNSARYPCAL